MASSIQFNSNYCEETQILSLAPIRLRLIRTDDKHHIVKAFEHLSTSSRYKRFFGSKKVLSDKELRYFTEIDQYDHFALGAFDLDDNGKEISVSGIARFIRLPMDIECAEVGITVIDSAQGKGIGKILLERLFSAALERGIKRLRFECLAENQDMQRLVKKLQVHVKFEREYDLLIAEIVIPEPSPGTHQFPMEIIENISVLLRTISTDTFVLYTDFSMGMLRYALGAATKYTIKRENKIVECARNSKAN